MELEIRAGGRINFKVERAPDGQGQLLPNNAAFLLEIGDHFFYPMFKDSNNMLTEMGQQVAIDVIAAGLSMLVAGMGDAITKQEIFKRLSGSYDDFVKMRSGNAEMKEEYNVVGPRPTKPSEN